jgi:predicted TIM-barrel fold metal-dependent hydrolase
VTMAEQQEFIYVRDRNLPYESFDADNHLYENRDALTKFLPKGWEGLVKYIEVDGRTRVAINGVISDYIPNPTFARVAVPGGYGRDLTKGGKHDDLNPMGVLAKPKAMPAPAAFFDAEPRYALMKDMGIDRALLFPTLATGLEERLADDPDAAMIAVHAFNEWMFEHWTFNYEDTIYPTPLISLAVMDRAIEELQWIAERGAKVFLFRQGPVPTLRGRRSFALPEFDPFWRLVEELDLAVGMHAMDSGYQRYMNDWEGNAGRETLAFRDSGAPAFAALMSEKSGLIDTLASIIGHGLGTRFPGLRFAPIEFPYTWIRPFYDKMLRLYDSSPVIFDENPVDVFNRNIWVHAFYDPEPQGLIDMGIPVDHIVFGSDFPHPEGMADPLAYSEVLQDLPSASQALIMGGSLRRFMHIPDRVNAFETPSP